MAQEDNPLSMSDEDFENQPIPEDNEDDLQEEEETSQEVEEEEEDVQEGTPEPPEEDDEPEEGDSTTEPSEEAPATSEIDYKAEYDRILSPFKANGRDIKVDSVEEAISLMQMGANYTKKMAALKPNLKIVKTLENNGLLDESKLNYLIELSNKNPEAIKKLLKESELDPLDLDLEDADKYQPQSYQVSDKEVELDTVLDEIKETPTFNETINIISSKFDDASKQVIVNEPTLVKVLNDHVSSGIYKQITDVVEKERMLGRLTGMSDLEAYKTVGDAINAQGGFNHIKNGAPKSSQIDFTNDVKAKRTDDSKIKQQKKAASSTKGRPASSKPDFSPLALSDEEFEKLSASKFI